MTEESIFREALAKPVAERLAFLDAACAGQPELRAGVDKLLAAHEDAGDPLDRPPAGGAAASAGADRQSDPGKTVTYEASGVAPGVVIGGRYVLVEQIGEGGMGTVWVAKQTEPIKRKVALKLIKPGMDSRLVMQRFEQERQALALMDHPHIARVFDGGLTADHRPFFVMELVNGLPLTKFCDETRLGIRERLELFVPICQAVQHAHQKGIVHRDLKPSNILVTLIDGRAVPKVIDFGVAKATGGKLTDESLSTQFGAVVGTLEYMSPEQAGFSGADVDTRADIYSLGVILYEVLTGLKPFDAGRLKRAAFDELIRIIREEDPPTPSKRLSTDDGLPSLAAVRRIEPSRLTSILRGDLDWVVMKCLEKQRDRRYETANALARDVQRYLANEVIEARPPTAAYRLRKFVRRNRAMVAGLTSAAILLPVMLFLIGLTMASRSERDRANQAEEEARVARDAAIEAQKREALAKAEAITQKEKAQESELSAWLQRKMEGRTNYALGADSLPQKGVPQGKLEGPFEQKSAIYPNTIRKYWIHVPAQYDPATPAALLVFQDGGRAINPRGLLRVPTVLDNLIHKKEMPVTIGVFINAGQRGDKTPENDTTSGNNFQVEYDSLGDTYSRFLLEEILPEVEKKYKLTKDPEWRAIGGSGSGAICAFTVAWERPDQFRKVISMIGKFTAARGGDAYPEMIRKADKKPIRVFLQVGLYDNRNPSDVKRDGYLQNQLMREAFTEKGYDFQYVLGQSDHSDYHGGSILPDIMRWLWRDYPK